MPLVTDLIANYYHYYQPPYSCVFSIDFQESLIGCVLKIHFHQIVQCSRKHYQLPRSGSNANKTSA